MQIAKGLILSGLTILFACAQTESQAPLASIDSNNVTIHVSQVTAADCTIANQARGYGDGGGVGGRSVTGSRLSPTISLTNSCTGYKVDLSGSAEGAESVIININDKEYSISVASDGSFSFQIITASVDNLSVILTPMDAEGVLGSAITIDTISKIAVDVAAN